jgi:hypothetical protein
VFQFAGRGAVEQPVIGFGVPPEAEDQFGHSDVRAAVRDLGGWCELSRRQPLVDDAGVFPVAFCGAVRAEENVAVTGQPPVGSETTA